jgi:hypothetical protein
LALTQVCFRSLFRKRKGATHAIIPLLFSRQ